MPIPNRKNPFKTRISKKRIRKLARNIRPIVRYARGPAGIFSAKQGYLYDEYPHYFRPINYDPFTPIFGMNFHPLERATYLKPLGEIVTYHPYTSREVLCLYACDVIDQIPKELLDQVIAFEITRVHDLQEDTEAVNAGYHVATTMLYTQRSYLWVDK